MRIFFYIETQNRSSQMKTFASPPRICSKEIIYSFFSAQKKVERNENCFFQTNSALAGGETNFRLIQTFFFSVFFIL